MISTNDVKHPRIALALTLGFAVGSQLIPASAANAAPGYSIKDTAAMSAIVSNINGTWTSPPIEAEGPDSSAEIGNGSLAIGVGGAPNQLKLWCALTGLFDPGSADFRGLGLVTISSNGTEPGGGDWNMTNHLRSSVVKSGISMGGQAISGKIWVSDSDDVAFCELTNTGASAVTLKADLTTWDGTAASIGQSGDSVAWASRDLSGTKGGSGTNRVRYAIAMKNLGGPGTVSAANGHTILTFTVNPGSTASLVIHAAVNLNAPNSPKDTVIDFVRKFAWNNAWWLNHVSYWDAFWYRSYINTGNATLNRWWYGHLYWMACASRAGEGNYAPTTYGPWPNSKGVWWPQLWGNYNGEAPFYGVAGANHMEILQPYVKALHRHQAQALARTAYCNAHPTDNSLLGANVRSKMMSPFRGGQNAGIFNGLGIGGHGAGDLGAGIWNQPTNGVNQLTPAVDYYKYSPMGVTDRIFTDTLYPILKNQADFITDYVHSIGKVNGKYQMWGCAHEDQWVQNSTYDLAWVRYIMKEMLAASNASGLDAASRPVWQGILDSLQPYLTANWNGKTILSESQQVPMNSDGNLNCILQFVAAGMVSASDDPAFLAIIRNTIDKTNDWGNLNAYSTYYSMAARSFYDPNTIINNMITKRTLIHGIHASDGIAGGMEVAATIDAINCLFLQSHDGIIRIFPNCPTSLDVKFQGLRAQGAFMVEARHTTANTIDDAVYIYSEAGKRCAVKNPWPGQAITVLNNGAAVASTNANEIYTFNTAAGQTYQIKRGTVAIRDPGAGPQSPSLRIVRIITRNSNVSILFNAGDVRQECDVAVYSLKGDQVFAATVPTSGPGPHSVTWKPGKRSGSYVATVRMGSASAEKHFTLK